MFYDTRSKAPLRYDPVKALVAPRPIGWISTLSCDGVANLAPYSFFNLVASGPSIVAFSSAGRKDSQTNAEQTGEFVCNIASFDQREAVNSSAATLPPEVDEFALTGLGTLPSQLIKPPRVKGAPAHLECVYLQTVPLFSKDGVRNGFDLILGEVVGVHIDDQFVKEGLVDTAAMRLIARLGYLDYSVTDEVFTLKRPD
ncbi:MAG: flavin reductase family protein [Caulobacteraceae bacterium]|jgi:flavin reductase (DIM6/NTAB) family NADH-FMN oxidoreductase RutF|nr:flavin reductase family protein [Caulobacteraceae bacterium]